MKQANIHKHRKFKSKCYAIVFDNVFNLSKSPSTCSKNVQYTPTDLSAYNFACVCAFFNTGSILVAFITSPLTFNFPLMNSFCAFALPATSCAKSFSLRLSVTLAFLPEGATPLPTLPVSLRSMCHDSVSPDAFLSVKAKMALPFLMAS